MHKFNKLVLILQGVGKMTKNKNAFIPVRQVGQLLFLSGQTCRKNGKLLYTGKVGKDLTTEEGKKAAKQCMKNLIEQLELYLGHLDRVKNVIKVNGFVQTNEYYEEQGLVMNAASELLLKTFGEQRGQHARSAIGVESLPGNSAVEIEMIVEVT